MIDDNVFASVVPRGELRELVAAIWLHRGPSATHRRDLVLPTGDTDLVINLGDLDGGATVVGPTTSPVVVDTASQRETLGVVFRVVEPSPCSAFRSPRSATSACRWMRSGARGQAGFASRRSPHRPPVRG